MFPRSSAMRVVVVLRMGFIVVNIAGRIMIVFIERAVMFDALADQIQFRFRQNTLTLQNLTASMLHAFQGLAGESLKKFIHRARLCACDHNRLPVHRLANWP